MYNAINTSLETRKREIVRLITIGMEEKQINKMLFAENGICRNTCINIRNCYWNYSIIYSLFSEYWLFMVFFWNAMDAYNNKYFSNITSYNNINYLLEEKNLCRWFNGYTKKGRILSIWIRHELMFGDGAKMHMHFCPVPKHQLYTNI